jgi:hypothetical protein
LKLWGKDSNDQVIFDVNGCLFKENFSSEGAGLYAGRYSSGDVEKTVFDRNTACSNGGGSYRGGIYEDCLGEATIYRDCVFIENKSGYTQDGDLSIGSGMGGAIGSRLYARIECYNCSFVNNKSGGRWHRGDSIFHWSAAGYFDREEERSNIYDCSFYGNNGNDIQIRANPYGFSEVDNCAYEAGEFECEGVNPTNTTLIGNN